MEFLNTIILGSQAGIFGERVFDPVEKDKIGNPAYDPQFFEAFPTLWANAYAFQKSIESPDDRDQTDIEEWVCLFLLYFFQILHLEPYPKEVLEKNFDKDLWQAASGTYPEADLSTLKVLKASGGVIVGAYYPTVVFFPSRGRAFWQNSPTLRLYLDGTKLSWERCKENLLTEANATNRFHSLLRGIANFALEGELRNALDAFCDGDPVLQVATQEKPQMLTQDPSEWVLLGRPTPKELLENYPLKQRRGTKTIYYLVSGMQPLSGWMTAAIGPGMPAPVDYTEAGERRIVVQFPDRPVECEIEEEDQIVPLKKLLLYDHTYTCGIPKQSDTRASMVRSFHKLEVRDDRGVFATLEGKTAVCLAPLRCEFLEHFPEVLQNPERAVRARRSQTRDEIDWTFTILGKEINWPARLVHATELPHSSFALWPPKMSQTWHFYVARGTGKKKESGRWFLVDERGKEGTNIEMYENEHEGESEEYVSILMDSQAANRPMALHLKDEANRERGVLFLNRLEDKSAEPLRSASLAVDFGTSNTCIAYTVETIQPQPEPLIFELSPKMLWGDLPEAELETPGFIPFQWGGAKGFYPSVLFTRRWAHIKEVKREDIQVKHLFQAAIPGLHKRLHQRVYRGGLTDIWLPHENLKWKLGSKEPYRSLFLWLSLLYAHAEIFFKHNAKVENYVFTFPLALPDEERKYFHKDAKSGITKTRQHCYGDRSGDGEYSDNVDESTAIARSTQAFGLPTAVEVFIDLGGGTADVAIRHNGKNLVLESIRLAGKTFFQFARKNFDPPQLCGAPRFRSHLGQLLENDDRELDMKGVVYDDPLGTYYSLLINLLDDGQFREKETIILGNTMGTPSYQKYRSQLFFRHVIAYALLQACAAVVDKKLTLKDGLRLTLGGNAWALMMFAEFRRSKQELKKESEEILGVLKDHLLSYVTEDEKQFVEQLHVFDIQLLNEQDLSEAKTAVAKGALLDLERDSLRTETSEESARPYTGITMKNLRINRLDRTITVRWCDRWAFETLKEKLPDSKGLSQIESIEFEPLENYRGPLDPLLSIFTCLGNIAGYNIDQMQPEVWFKINALLHRGDAYLENRKPKYAPVNYFLCSVLYPERDHDYLDELAEGNETYK